MTFKVATFNANSIRARMPIILDWLKENQPDLLCIQETKVQDKDFPIKDLEQSGYMANFWGQKSYNGVAVLSKKEPAKVIINFPDGQEEDQARLIAVQLDGIWVVNTYVPQGKAVDDPAFEYKLDFIDKLHKWFKADFDPEKPFLWVGDLNVAPTPLDVHDPVKLDGRVCYHPREREALKKAMSWGLVDLFRIHNPEEKLFTFFDYRVRNAVQRNVGWRIDHLLGTKVLADNCVKSYVDMEPRLKEKPSDHTFLVAEFELG